MGVAKKGRGNNFQNCSTSSKVLYGCQLVISGEKSFLARRATIIPFGPLLHNYIYFIKPFNRGQILQSGRGVNSILITILRFDHLPEKIELFPFSLTASFSACREIHLRKVIFRLNLVKLGSEILNLFLAEKWSFVYSLFCYNTLRNKLFDALGIAQPLV